MKLKHVHLKPSKTASNTLDFKRFRIRREAKGDEPATLDTLFEDIKPLVNDINATASYFSVEEVQKSLNQLVKIIFLDRKFYFTGVWVDKICQLEISKLN